MSLLRQDRWQSIDSLELLKGGKDYFQVVESALLKPQKSIYLETYIFSADEQAQKIGNWVSYIFVRFVLSIITAKTKDKALPSIRD